MKKKIALLLCTILVVLPFTFVMASAAEYNSENDAEYIQIAQQLAQAYTTIPEEQFEQYNQMGVIPEAEAEILQSWYEISESVGSQIQPGEGTVKLQGEDIVVTVPITGENGSAYFVANFDGNLSIDEMYQSQTGGMKSAKYTLTLEENSGSLGTKMKNAALNTLMGMVSVFIILIIIICVISLLKYAPMMVEKLSGKNKEPNVPAAKEAPAAVSSPVVQTDDTALIAVITAAAAAALSEETGTAVTTDQLIVRSIKRAGKR